MLYLISTQTLSACYVHSKALKPVDVCETSCVYHQHHHIFAKVTQFMCLLSLSANAKQSYTSVYPVIQTPQKVSPPLSATLMDISVNIRPEIMILDILAVLLCFM